MEEIIREAIFKSLKENKKDIQRPKTANAWREEGETKREGEVKKEEQEGGERREERVGKKVRESISRKNDYEKWQKEEGGKSGNQAQSKLRREEEEEGRKEVSKEEERKKKEGGGKKEDEGERDNYKLKFLSLSDEVEDLRRIGEFLNNPKATELEYFLREINEIILFLVKLVEFTKSHELGLKFLKRIPNFLGGDDEKVTDESFGKILSLYHVNLNVIFREIISFF